MRANTLDLATNSRKAFEAALVGGYHATGSALNLGLTVAVAASLSAENFGYFSLALTTYIFCAGIWRSIGSEAALITFSKTDLPSRRQVRQLRLNALMAGVATCVVLVALALAVPGSRSAALALFFPVVAFSLADAEHAILLSAGRATTVTLLTSIPAVVSLSLAVLTAGDFVEVSMFSVGLILGLASVLTILLARRLVSQLAHPNDVSESRVQGRPRVTEVAQAGRALTVEYLIMAGSFQLSAFAVAALASVEQAGGYRGTILATSPLTTLLVGMHHLMVVKLRNDPSPARIETLRNSIVPITVAIGLVTTAAIVVVFKIGHIVFADSWPATKSALIPMGLAVALSTPMTISSAVVRATRRFRTMLWLRAVQLPIAIGAILIGSAAGGAGGAAIGLALTSAVLTPAWLVSAFEWNVRVPLPWSWGPR